MDIQFVWREDKVNSEGMAPIYLHTRAAVDGRLRKPTGIKSTKKFSSRVNVLLNNIRAKLEDLEYNYSLQEKKIYRKDIEACLPPKKGVQEVSKIEGKSVFFCHWDNWVEESRTRASEVTGKVIAPSTILIYKSIKNRLEKFEEVAKYEITSGSINKEFYTRLRKYVIGDCGLSITTFSNYIKNIKVFCQYLQEKDPGLNNDFRKFKRQFIYSEAKPLYKSELLLLYNVCHLEPHIEKARLILLFLCSTAMRISDYNSFKENEIIGQMIVHTSKKTNAQFYVPFYDDIYFRPMEILADLKSRFGRKPKVSGLNRFNKYIAIASELAGITRIIPTSKTGRKSYATLKLLDGVPAEVIMKSTGHKTRAAFDAYVGINTDDILKAYRDKAVNFKVG
jgi:integrase